MTTFIQPVHVPLTTKGAVDKRWEVFNKRTGKTVRFVSSRAMARQIKTDKATPRNYGIYDTVTSRYVR